MRRELLRRAGGVTTPPGRRGRIAYCDVQHSSEAGPGQWPGVETWPSLAQIVVEMHAPAVPLTEHEGGGVQHSMFDGPGQWPAVET